VQKTFPSSYRTRQSSGTSDAEERLINVKNCPICHRPQLNKKAEMDIITLVAVCVSGDWAKIDKIVVGNFVTAGRAQRKWYTKVISKVSSGDYRLGAVRFCVFAFPLYLNAWSDSLFIEFSKYHRAESHDWPAGGREVALLCAAWH
jgi:hypothetical protein